MKVLFVIADKDFRDEELFDTKEEIEKAGIETKTANLSGKESTGSLGGKAKPNIKLADVNPFEFDGIIFVGGQGSSQYFNDTTAIELAKKFFEQKKLTAAICIAPNILANAGILKDKKATAWGDGKDISGKGAIFTGKQVEADGKIITANGPKAAREFGKKIAEILKG